MGRNWQSLAVACTVIFMITTLLSGFKEAEGSLSHSTVKSQQSPQHIITLMDKKLSDIGVMTNRAHIYARSHQTGFESYDEMMKYLENWNLTDDDMNTIRNKVNSSKKWNGTFSEQKSSYTKKTSIFIQPMTSSKDQYEVYTIYEASFLPISTKDTAFHLFSKNALLNNYDPADIFLRIEGTVSENDALNVQQMGQKLMDTFSAQVVEEVQEDNFVSLSALTPHWNNKLITNGQEMNLQAAVRQLDYNEGLGGKTTVTIGTPLITTEY
ncbi:MULTISPECIES: YwmB family TATA-box binding protein [Bacillaceae]|uniref:YwmB family TATA-box binding protein n=1 Tax=Evansella alkalicola TaxID=745819 RepID=A0ABS6JXV2_9BACI|nr:MULTISPECIES: YwmB family TATA-box binding protein [Bacillaceae]MBU9723410.1 YwmB family TATA-box binding protein [Bacillus alkalicola]